jgi:vancomycin permeability regulator SanA
MLSDYRANKIFDANISHIIICTNFNIHRHIIYSFCHIYISTNTFETNKESLKLPVMYHNRMPWMSYTRNHFRCARLSSNYLLIVSSNNVET